MEIAGREEELRAIAGRLAEEGSGAVLLRGEAGIGKTTLWQRCVADASAAGATVLACAPGAAETGIAYAGLADLLAPLLPDVLPAVPSRQRRALEGALLLGDAGPGQLDERAVAFGALGALRAAARDGDVVVAIDDVQWLDPSTTVALGYALRRVAADGRLLLILAQRATPAEAATPLAASLPPERVLTVHVGPLSLGALHRAIREALGSPLPRPALVRVFDACAGNPFHAIEAARALLLPGGTGPRTLPAGGVEALLHARLAALPRTCRAALLLAAAAVHPTLGRLETLLDGRPELVLAPALEAGLVRLAGGRVGFTHPLLAQAVTSAAGAAAAAAAHRRLAAAASTVEERAIHLARAADGTDAGLAAALDAAVDAARTRGAQATAADLAELAAGSTPAAEEPARLRRLLDAADAAFAAGDAARARRLLEGVAAADEPLRYRALWRLGVVLDETVGGDAALEPLHGALGTGDPALASAVRRSLAQLAFYTGSLEAAYGHAEAAVEQARRCPGPAESAYALGVQALVGFYLGLPDWHTVLAEALALEAAAAPLPDLDLSPSAIAADLDRAALRLPKARAAYNRLHALAVERQDVPVEAWAVYGLGQVALLSADVEAAGAYARESLDLAEGTGLLRLPALRCAAGHAILAGDAGAAARLIDEVVEAATAGGELLNLRSALALRGALALALGDPAGAVEPLRRAREVAGHQQVGGTALLLPLADEVEALALMGDVAAATALLPALTGPTPLALRAGGAVAAATGDLAGAAGLLRQAVAREAELPLPLEQARARLALGRTLRRAKQRAEARTVLAEAQRRCVELGAPLWAAQAQAELARIGGRRGSDGLTPAERRVAELVAAGHSNREAAATLFLTVKTVETTLSRVYAKLGVRSRTALGRALAGQTAGESRLSPGPPGP